MNIDELLDAAYNKGYTAGWEDGKDCRLKVTHDNSREKAQLIIHMIEKICNVTYEAMQKKTRKRPVVFPRQMCMYLMTMFTKMKLREIGELFGGRDHTTAVHSRSIIKDLISNDDDLSKQIMNVQARVKEALDSNDPVLINLPTLTFTAKLSYAERKKLYRRAIIKKHKAEVPVVEIKRPPAEYTNMGNINILKRLAE